jgi:hypothetical protein
MDTLITYSKELSRIFRTLLSELINPYHTRAYYVTFETLNHAKITIQSSLSFMSTHKTHLSQAYQVYY